MGRKLLISAVIVMAAIGVALAWRTTPKVNPKVQEAKKHDVKILVKQLETKSNGVPVEIIQETAISSAPHILDDVTFALRNNSGKPISAVAVTKKVLYRENGKLYGIYGMQRWIFLFILIWPMQNRLCQILK